MTFFVDPYCDQSKLVWRTKSALGVKTHVIANGSKRQMEALLVEAQRVFGVWLMNGCKDEE